MNVHLLRIAHPKDSQKLVFTECILQICNKRGLTGKRLKEYSRA